MAWWVCGFVLCFWWFWLHLLCRDFLHREQWSLVSGIHVAHCLCWKRSRWYSSLWLHRCMRALRAVWATSCSLSVLQLRFSDVLAVYGSCCDSGGLASLVAPRWTSLKIPTSQASTWHTARDGTFSDGTAFTGSIGTCVTACKFLSVSVDGRASSGDGFSHMLHLSL